MSFTTDGNLPVEIIGATVTKAKFAQAPALDVWLQVRGDDGATDWWRGEVSTNYGKGNFSDRTQAQITAESLLSIGYQHGADLSQLATLVGVKTQAYIKRVEKDGNTYYNVAGIGGGGGNGPELALDNAAIQERMGQMFGVANPQPAQPAPPPAAAPGNPFAQ